MPVRSNTQTFFPTKWSLVYWGVGCKKFCSLCKRLHYVKINLQKCIHHRFMVSDLCFFPVGLIMTCISYFGGWLQVTSNYDVCHVISIFCLHKGVVARLYVTCNYPYQCNGFGYHAIHDLKKIKLQLKRGISCQCTFSVPSTLLGIAIKHFQTLFTAR